jgi:hypothetical protein
VDGHLVPVSAYLSKGAPFVCLPDPDFNLGLLVIFCVLLRRIGDGDWESGPETIFLVVFASVYEDVGRLRGSSLVRDCDSAVSGVVCVGVGSTPKGPCREGPSLPRVKDGVLGIFGGIRGSWHFYRLSSTSGLWTFTVEL